MNRTYQSAFVIFILSIFFSFSLSAEIFQSVKSPDGEWIFVTETEDGNPYENLYVQNTTDPSKSKMILENPAKVPFVFSNLCFNPKNEALYFSIHNGGEFVNGVQLFRGEGIYVLKKDSEGNYSSKGLRRFAKLEPWIVERAKSAFLDNSPHPDYKEFLKFLFEFADYDAEPCFVYKADSGKNLLNEEAVRCLHESKKLDALVLEEKDYYHSVLEDFLFCLDENSNPTEKHAVTANHCKLFYIEGSMHADCHFFTEYKGHVFMLENLGSMKNGGWSLDFSKVFLISDSGDDFMLKEPENFSRIKAEVFEFPFPKRLDSAPIFVHDGKLYLRDINHTDFHLLQKDFSFKKVSSISGDDFSFLAIAFLASTVFLLFLSAFLFFRFRKINSPRFIFGEQQKVRAEISSAIHDSVVQDIRAIRLDVERLKVEDESSELQKSAVQNLTECVKKMRDICYGLNPAEIAVAEFKGSKVDIISVIQTLCDQFSRRTKIQFHLDTDGSIQKISVKNDDAKYITRICMEILSNVEKHSYATNLTLLIREKDNPREGKTATLIFIDDGTGCDIKSVTAGNKTHFGIRNMMQYAKLAGVKIDFLTAKDEGMQVMLCIKEAE
ncbi:MAG: hypothetical protein K6B17_04185 [Treponema sp.]|nr:hypothetical protein [Treponema sp.]